MTQTVNVPGVGQLNFPDGMSQQDMAAAIQRNFPQLHAAPAAPSGDDSSFLGNVAAGIGKGATDFAYGAKQRLDDAAAYLENHLGGQSVNAALGMQNASDIQKQDQALVDEKRKVDAPLMETAGGKIGNFVGGMVPGAATAFIPGAQTLAGSVITGGALGAAAPTTTGESVLKNAAGGAAGGALGYGVAKGISSILSPLSSANPELQLLRSEGVEPTIGQTLGGVANKVEQKLQSVPILGDGIVAARSRALNQFDNAAINRATAPIGVQIDGTGQQAVKQAGDALSAAYDSALSQVPHVTLDGQFAAELQQLHGMTQNLVPQLAQKFDRTLNDLVLDRVSPQGSMLGDTYKAVDSELGNIASRFSKSQVASEAEYGDAVGQLKNLLNQNMRRNNPAVAAQLDKVDEGWANLVRIEQAAKSAKNAQGVFTPAQLNMAVQSADDSVRGRAVARGTALMQDLSGAGQSILGGNVPDSGTAGRLALGGASLAAGFAQPAIPIGLGAGALAYSQPMQAILNHVISTRPQMVVPVANTISKYASAAGLLGSVAAVTQRQRSDQAIGDIGRATNVQDAISAAQRAVSP